jgi:hypothetical protein
MTFEKAETFRWNPFDVTKVIHLLAGKQFVLYRRNITCRIIMHLSVQLQIREFGNLGFRNISASCIYVTRNFWVPVSEVVSP